MRIAFVLGRFPVLSETFILSQITGLIDRGHDVEIFAGRPDSLDVVHPDVERYDLVSRTHYWPSIDALGDPETLAGYGRNAASSVGAALRTAANALTPGSPTDPNETPLALRSMVTADKGPFDALVSHFGHVANETQILRDMGALEGPLVTFFHAYDLTVYLREQGPSCYRRLFEAGDCFFPISRHWKYRLEELGCPPERTEVHHMGIDCERFEFHERRADDGPLRLVSIARMVEKKGLYYALRALSELGEVRERLEYHIVGDGPLRSRLEDLVDEFDLREQVRFRGWCTHDEIAEILDQMHVLLAPSVTALDGDTEGIPMVLMEAMARGLPVVSTYHSGIPELVDDGESGYLVPERDVEALAERIERLVAEPARWAAMGRAGRAKVEEAFDIDRLNDRLVRRLERLHGGPAG